MCVKGYSAFARSQWKMGVPTYLLRGEGRSPEPGLHQHSSKNETLIENGCFLLPFPGLVIRIEQVADNITDNFPVGGPVIAVYDNPPNQEKIHEPAEVSKGDLKHYFPEMNGEKNIEGVSREIAGLFQ